MAPGLRVPTSGYGLRRGARTLTTERRKEALTLESGVALLESGSTLTTPLARCRPT